MARATGRARAPGRLLGSLLIVLAGCASQPPPLPAALPSALPGAWLDPLRACGCSGPFRSHLRLQVTAPGHATTTIDGSLRAILPDTLWLTAGIGSFKPLFALLASADSAELLVHPQARYWITPRSAADWDSMSPATWARALHWALCPADLLRQFVPDGPGTMDADLWTLEGTVPRDSLRLRIRIDPQTSSVREIRISRSGVERCLARLASMTRVGTTWIPTVLDLRLPRDGFRLQAELLAIKPTARSALALPAFPRPPGWAQVREGEIVPGAP